MKTGTIAGLGVLLIAFSATGCTSLSLKAKNVQLTDADSDVADCKFLGDIQVSGSLQVPGQGTNELRNKGAAMGADVVLYKSPIVGSSSGKAYNCGGRYAPKK
jgi:hypothetical protein